jgi:hypothetical protein
MGIDDRLSMRLRRGLRDGEDISAEKSGQKTEGPPGGGPSRGESSKANARMAAEPFPRAQSNGRAQNQSREKGKNSTRGKWFIVSELREF